MTNFVIENDEQLIATVNEINCSLAAIQNYCTIDKNELARIKFPRGFLRTAFFHRKKMPAGLDALLLHNISYSLMTLDVIRWLVIRTDISGAAQSMIIKRAVTTLAEVMDALLKNYCGKNKSFDKCVGQLKLDGVFDDNCAGDLIDVWRLRSSVHLWEASGLEHNKFTPAVYNKTAITYDTLIKGLVHRYGNAIT